MKSGDKTCRALVIKNNYHTYFKAHSLAVNGIPYFEAISSLVNL